MADWIEARGADLVVLAGYMQLLSPRLHRPLPQPRRQRPPRAAARFPRPRRDRPGARRRASSVTGVTVHFVDEGVDTGPAILQREVPVPAGRDREALEAAIHAVRARALPGGDPHDRGGPG